jgi:hypothetical protein
MSDLSLEQLLAELSQEDVPIEFDFAAPESGSFAPSIQPGVYEFIPSLRSDAGVGGFDKVVVDGHKHLQAILDFDVIVPGKDNAKVTYQRVSTYKHEKVAISSMGEFLRSVGLHTQIPERPSYEDITRVLMSSNGHARGRGEAAWRFYCKTHGLTISTSPRKRKGIKDTPWPRQADGSLEPAVSCPQCGAAAPKSYGQVEFIRYFTQKPESAASATS